MPYAAEISRTNPTCFLFMIDQSGSMGDTWGGEPGIKKADQVASIVNRLLSDIVLKCSKDDGIRNYFEVGVVGYGARVGSAYGGSLAGRMLVPIADLGDAPVRVDRRKRKESDGAGGVYEREVPFPIWFDPVANGGTPMRQAFTTVIGTLGEWVKQHPNSHPPIIFNVTDGESTDGNPSDLADRLMNLGTSDGNALLFNIHVSSQRAAEVTFPSSPTALVDDYARLLFGMSSALTGEMRSKLNSEGYTLDPGARGFLFNADSVAVVNFLDIGTRPANISELR